MAQKGETLVEVKDLCKNFGVTIALSHVDFVVKTGEIRGLIGENGSGKSTVSSIIAGMQPASSGEMFYKGKPWKPATMLEAQKAGIGMIVQEAGTIANISVAENIFLGNYDKFKKGPIINKVAMISEARKALEKIGVTNINLRCPPATMTCRNASSSRSPSACGEKSRLYICGESCYTWLHRQRWEREEDRTDSSW